MIHWTIALVVLLDAFILEEGDAAHRWWGYLAFGLVLIRFYYGLKIRHIPGPNRMASVVYILIWLLIIGLAVTGWMLGLDAFWGDEKIETLHAQMSDGLLVLVAIHFIGIISDAIIYKRKTWMGMIDGKRR